MHIIKEEFKMEYALLFLSVAAFLTVSTLVMTSSV